MKTDIQIAQEAKMLKINKVAENMGILDDELDMYGKYKAKVDLSLLDRLKDEKDGKLILVTATTPTPAGEGKSTVTVGLTEAMNKMGVKAIAALREPSLGPVFGMKGGATGGGYAQVIPMEDINLHFTGDLHAIGVANNLIAACIDNHLHSGNALNIDVTKINWKRVIDMNDRSLRDIVIGLGGKANGIPRQSSFQITVASEIMAALCLASSITDLKEKIKNMIVAFNTSGEPVRVGDLNIEGAVAALLKEAIKPNLVQTLENTGVFIHGGPFANIAHGCNSLLATKMALKLGDYAITEAGFAADLGAEKFFDIKCPKGELKPNCVIIVTTVRALMHHGDGDLEKGLANLDKHIENVAKYKVPSVVAINKFVTDTPEQIECIENHCKKYDVPVELVEVWALGGEGGINLAKKVMELVESGKDDFTPLYNKDELNIKEKITLICKEIYGAKGVVFSPKAKKMLDTITKFGYDNLPVCMSKTQKSISDNPKLIGRPTDFEVEINELRISAGAGFIVAMAGSIIDMPGLPKKPSAEVIDIDANSEISGLF